MKHLERALQGRNSIGWYILMLVLVIFIAQLAAIPLFLLSIPLVKNGGNFDDIMSAIENPTEFRISNNLALALMMLTFVLLFFAFALLVKPLHERSLRETINGRKHIRWNRVWTGIIVWGALLVASIIVSLLTSSPGDYEFRFNPSALIGLTLVILIFMPFQTSIEEVLFRGYLAQGVGKWTKNRWWALIIPSVLFALLHSANPEVKEYGFWLMMPNYLLMGLLLGIISILDDGIELALGIHFINNALSSILITFESSVLQTDALFILHNVNSVYSLIEMTILTILAIYILQRIYKWDFGIMNKKVKIVPPPLPVQTMETEQTQGLIR